MKDIHVVPAEPGDAEPLARVIAAAFHDLTAVDALERLT